ncbi:exodeoxyribonuclease V subunit alpha [Nitriliruptoraceae bacterium ZYF776]|nr:exodeoxyribonuclease V subunit alpha [Profundirhabdus halotolerans]
MPSTVGAEVSRRAVARELAVRAAAPTVAPDHVARPPEALAPFVGAGVLTAPDVHVATALARRLGERDPAVLLATALAVRAPRRSDVCVDLTTVGATVVGDRVEDTLSDHSPERGPEHGPVAAGGDPLAELPWPPPDAWRSALAASPLVAVRDPRELTVPDDAGAEVAPLTLAGGRLYLDRYWRYERVLARSLRERAARPVAEVDTDLVASLLGPDTDPAPDLQRVAAALAATRHLTVVAGGPGTGKTTTVARILRLLDRLADANDRPRPAVALAAPTGKAAARLTESLREAAGPDDERLRELTAVTLHRLLGSRGAGRRFRHGPHDPLPHDVVVVDETSMVDVAVLARLLEAVRRDARVLLLGDPHQLASVEAGSVLADVVGDPDAPPRRSRDQLATLRAAVGDAHLADDAEVEDAGTDDAVVVLRRVHRFGATSGVARFAAAVRTGDADEAVAVLRDADDLRWVAPTDDDLDAWRRHGPSDAQLADVRARIEVVARELRDAALAGDGAAALGALDGLRVLCAHLRGGTGVEGWNVRIEAWWATALGVDVHDRWYLGRPVMVTANDHRLQLWNGDLGVVVAGPDGRPTVAVPAPDGVGTRQLTPGRIGDVATVHAMTVHRSQGSQTGHTVVVLPEPASRICTRELLYTAVTRARRSATIVASEPALRATVEARIHRASGLRDALRDGVLPG